MGDYIGIDLHKTVQEMGSGMSIDLFHVQEMGSGMSIDLFQMWRN